MRTYFCAETRKGKAAADENRLGPRHCQSGTDNMTHHRSSTTVQYFRIASLIRGHIEVNRTNECTINQNFD